MITVRRAKERHLDRRRRQEGWNTFGPAAPPDALAAGFGTLEMFNEARLPPGAGVPRHLHHNAEVVTYVRQGALKYEDSKGRSGIIHAGEFERMTAGGGIRHSLTNASRTEWAHAFQIWLHPLQAALDPDREQKRFCVAERRSGLCLVASPDGRRGSLHVHEDALIFSALLDSGVHVVHELPAGRSAWLHVVRGEVTLDDLVLFTGDGAGLTAERAVSLTASEESSILLVDLGERLPDLARTAASH